ncbi:taste receptor type 2 member 10-like [Rana temporaria]|uniref:taste receptor type 2 member 10-like n=1 Tax=Rana temporaria TaxID=8407 RepID=UPI001AADD192|nr:taste receptor type 2 member 10-like [Rana temporaria]
MRRVEHFSEADTTKNICSHKIPRHPEDIRACVLSEDNEHPGFCLKGTNSSPCNYLLIALNVSTMCYTISLTSNLLLYVFWPSLNVTYASSVLTYLTIISITSSSWLTAAMCFFYFIKILQFQSRFLSWMKMKIDRMIPLLIIFVEIVSLLESFMAAYIFNQDFPKNSTIAATDLTSEYQHIRLKFMNVILPVTSPPFLIAILTTAASAVSLKLHSHRMKANTGHANGKDYQGAVQTMACLVVLYALIGLVIIIFGQELFADQTWGYWICVMIIFSFPMVQSGLLINGNPKLKEPWRKCFTSL